MMPAKRLDISSNPVSKTIDPKSSQNSPKENNAIVKMSKKFLGIKFVCCGIYARIYINRDGTAYEGRCPKCMKQVKLRIGEGGSNHRFFEVH